MSRSIVQLFADMAEAGDEQVALKALKLSPLFERLQQQVLKSCRGNGLTDEEQVGLKIIGGFGDNAWSLLVRAFAKSVDLWSASKLRNV
jgi:hypothetical protein